MMHSRNFGPMPFLMPVTYVGASGNETQVRWVKIQCLNHYVMAAAF